MGDGSIRVSWRLQQRLDLLQAEEKRLERRNRAIETEVMGLKSGLGAVEEHARKDLGMIRKGETFFQIIEQSEPKKKQ